MKKLSDLNLRSHRVAVSFQWMSDEVLTLLSVPIGGLAWGSHSFDALSGGKSFPAASS